MNSKPSITVFRNTKTGDFSIVRFAINPKNGFRVAVGKLIRIGAEQASEGILSILLEILHRDTSISEGPSELQQMKSSQRSSFHRNNESVGIWLETADELMIQSLTKTKECGGAVGSPENRVVLKLPAKNEEFAKIFKAAFINDSVTHFSPSLRL